MRLRAENNQVSGGAERPTTRTDGVPNGVKRYVLDLDLPPLERYRHIIGDHLAAMSSINEYVEAAASGLAGSTIGSFALKCVQGVMNLSNKLSLVYYSDELRAIAELSGMPLGRVVLMQLIYEASAMCTSVACPLDREGHVGHIRTMDWEMDMLKGLTIEVEARRGGETLFVGSTWAGYVGVLTGVAVRPKQARHGFSVSVNFRSVGSGTLATNLRHAITRSWPIGFLVRETLTRATGYHMCVSWLTNSKLIAPCYFTVCGAGPWEACLITRCREESIRPLRLGALGLEGPTTRSVIRDSVRGKAKALFGWERPRFATNSENGKKISDETSEKSDAEAYLVEEQRAQKEEKSDLTSSAKRAHFLSTEPVTMYIVQPNMDHWLDFSEDDSVERLEVARKGFNALFEKYNIRAPSTMMISSSSEDALECSTSTSLESSAPPVGATCIGEKRLREEAQSPSTEQGLEESREKREVDGNRFSTAQQQPKEAIIGIGLGITLNELWSVMSLYPILDDVTIYGTFMDPRSGTIDTRIPIETRKGKNIRRNFL